jgi:DNA-binding beta-propeller fold protein YncE
VILSTFTTFAAGAALVACVGPAADPPAAAKVDSSFKPLGFYMLVDSSLVVVDMFDAKQVNKIKVGHHPVHQVAVMPDNRTVYTGDGDDNTIVKFVFGDNGKTYTKKVVAKSPVHLHFLSTSPDGKHVVITSREELNELMKLPPNSGLPDDSIAILDTQTDTIVKTIVLQSPAMPAFATDGKFLYVNNVHHGSVSVIETKTWTEIQRVTLDASSMAKTASGRHNVAPDGLDVSPDGKWVVTADYEARSLTVFAVGADGKLGESRKVPYPQSAGMPHDVRFAPDGKTFWVTDYDRLPDPGDELANMKIVTHVRVFDVVTLAEQKMITPTRAVGRVSLPQYSKSAYLTTNVGGMIVIDRATGELQAEVVSGGPGVPVICGMASY